MSGNVHIENEAKTQWEINKVVSTKLMKQKAPSIRLKIFL